MCTLARKRSFHSAKFFLINFGIVHLTISDPVSGTAQLLSLLDTWFKKYTGLKNIPVKKNAL